MISQKSPTRKPDLAKIYGRPRIPAPIIVPLRVNVVAQNFLFIVSPVVFRLRILLIVWGWLIFSVNLIKSFIVGMLELVV